MLLLGGGSKNDTSCVMIVNGEVSFQPLLKCNYEEVGDWILFHAYHDLKINNYKKLIIVSPDADISVIVNAPLFLLDVL